MAAGRKKRPTAKCKTFCFSIDDIVIPENRQHFSEEKMSYDYFVSIQSSPDRLS